jgi:hypothetical protein
MRKRCKLALKAPPWRRFKPKCMSVVEFICWPPTNRQLQFLHFALGMGECDPQIQS